MSKLIRFSGVGALAAILGAQAGYAQEDMFDRDRVVGAGERYHETFEPKPLRVGGLLFNPSLRAGVESNSNIYAENEDEQSDLIVRAAPRLKIGSDWNRHALSADLGVDHREYTDTGSETRTETFGGLRGRLDVARSVSLDAKAGVETRFESRGATGAERGVYEPGEYGLVYYGAGIEFQSERIELRVEGDQRELDYENLVVGDDFTGNPNRDFRDHTQSTVALRAAYAVTPDLAVYGLAELKSREYDNRQNATDPVLDSDATEFLLGLNFQTEGLLRGDVAVGVISEEREDDRFEDVEAVSVRADVDWLPTPLTTVSVGAKRYTSDSGSRDLPTSLVTEGKLRVDHELKRNIIIYAEGLYGVEVFDEPKQNIDYEQNFTSIGLGGLYKLNPHAHLDLSLERRSRDSDRNIDDYDQNIISAGVKLYP